MHKRFGPLRFGPLRLDWTRKARGWSCLLEVAIRPKLSHNHPDVDDQVEVAVHIWFLGHRCQHRDMCSL
eukprot:1035998-Rhodomonas_salina.1